jgi:hypothetical protein
MSLQSFAEGGGGGPGVVTQEPDDPGEATQGGLRSSLHPIGQGRRIDLDLECHILPKQTQIETSPLKMVP